jgi:hypothetical protein
VGILRAARNLDFVLRAVPDCPIPAGLAKRIREGEGVAVARELAAEIGSRPGMRLHVIPLGAERHARDVVESFDTARTRATV